MLSLERQIEMLEKHHNWQQIIDLLKPYVQQGNYEIWILRALGFAYSQLDRYDEARFCYKQWIELEPDRAQPYYHVGYTFYDAGHWNEAVEWFDQALERFPDYLVCLYRKGVALFMARKANQAKEVFQKAIIIYQNHQELSFKKRMSKYYYRSVFYLGKCYFQIRSFENARRCFNKIIAEDKRFYIDPVYVHYNLALSLMHLKEFQQAEQIVEEWTHKNPRAEWLFDFWGRLLIEQKRYAEAVDKFNTALKIRIQPYIFIDRARAYYLNGQIAQAKKDLHEALKRDKKGKHKVLLKLAKIAKEEKHFSEAIVFAKRAIEFKQKIYGADYLEAHLFLWEVYQTTGEKEKAEEEWQITQQLQPEIEWHDEELLNSKLMF